MRLKPANVTDPPDVVTGSIAVGIGPSHGAASQVLAFADRLDNRAVAITPTADVIDLGRARGLKEMPERVHEVKGVDVVSHLLTAIAEYHIMCVRHCALCEIREKTVHLR